MRCLVGAFLRGAHRSATATTAAKALPCHNHVSSHAVIGLLDAILQLFQRFRRQLRILEQIQHQQPRRAIEKTVNERVQRVAAGIGAVDPRKEDKGAPVFAMRDVPFFSMMRSSVSTVLYAGFGRAFSASTTSPTVASPLSQSTRISRSSPSVIVSDFGRGIQVS